MSLKEALPLLIKKLQCFSEIAASPNDVFNGTDFFINSQTFREVLSNGFLKVLPPVLILEGCALFFFLHNNPLTFLFYFFLNSSL